MMSGSSVMPGSLWSRGSRYDLGSRRLAGDLVRLRRDRPGAGQRGRKVMALLFAMVLGADSIDDV